jgi:hypothetical protein
MSRCYACRRMGRRRRTGVDGSLALRCCGVLLATGFWAPACGGQSSISADDASSTSGASGAAGQSQACPPIDAEMPTSNVTIAFRNDTAEAVHIPRHECSAFFRISAIEPDIAGSFPRSLTSDGDPLGRGVVLPLCSTLSDACTSSGAQNGCTFDLLELAPGGQVSFDWSGALYPMVSIPEECREQECEVEQCVGERAARPGRYRIYVQALSWLPRCESDDCSCQWVSGGTCCEVNPDCPCQPFDDGTCRHRSYSPDLDFLDATDLDVELEFEYPSVEPVLVVLE